METNVNYTLVGIFVISLTAAIVLAIVWLSSGFNTEQLENYRVYMTESVSGLSPDSPVEFNGVIVGSVKSIDINHENPQLVELLLEVKKGTPITQGTSATLNVKGLTGITFVALLDKGTDRTPLVAINDQPYPVIKTSPSFFLRLDAAITKLTNSLQQVSTSVRNLLDAENLHSIKASLHNIEDITGNLAANGEQLTAIMNNTAEASKQLAPLVKGANRAVQGLNIETFPSVNSAVSNISAVARDLKQNPAVLIRGKAPRAPGPGE